MHNLLGRRRFIAGVGVSALGTSALVPLAEANPKENNAMNVINHEIFDHHPDAPISDSAIVERLIQAHADAEAEFLRVIKKLEREGGDVEYGVPHPEYDPASDATDMTLASIMEFRTIDPAAAARKAEFLAKAIRDRGHMLEEYFMDALLDGMLPPNA